MGRLHYFILLLLVILLAIISGWIFDSFDKKESGSKQTRQHVPDYFLREFEATSMNSKGEPAYRTMATLLQHYPDDNSMQLQQPRFWLYQKKQPAWYATALQATDYPQRGELQLAGKVQLRQLNPAAHRSPLQLEGEQLVIQADKNRLYSTEAVTLRQGNNTIAAIGMRADLKQQQLEFLSRTRTRYRNIRINAKRLHIDQAKGISRYDGQVQFHRDSLHIEADHMILYYHNDKLQRAIISGKPASVTQTPANETAITAHALQMEYFADSELLRLSGNAVVQQGEKRFSGAVIEYNSREKTVQADGQPAAASTADKTAPKRRVHVILGNDNNDTP